MSRRSRHEQRRRVLAMLERRLVSFTPQTDKLSRAKGLLAEVLADYPEEAHGSAWLEEAIERVGRCESEVEPVEEDCDRASFEHVESARLPADPCGCRSTCGDDGDVDGPGTCKGLPRAPEPLVEVILRHRDEL